MLYILSFASALELLGVCNRFDGVTIELVTDNGFEPDSVRWEARDAEARDTEEDMDDEEDNWGRTEGGECTRDSVEEEG